MQGWGITNLFTPEQRNDGRTITVDVAFQDMIDPREPLYWVAPEPYLGNKITSYGGKLFYTVKFTPAENVDSRGYVKADVRIEVFTSWLYIPQTLSQIFNGYKKFL